MKEWYVQEVTVNKDTKELFMVNQPEFISGLNFVGMLSKLSERFAEFESIGAQKPVQGLMLNEVEIPALLVDLNLKGGSTRKFFILPPRIKALSA
jgi:hypothetical protein